MTRFQCPGLFALFTGVLILALSVQLPLLAQGQPQRAKVAVLRFKSSQETPERRNIVKDLSKNLAAALREVAQLEVADDATVKEAIQDEGLKPDGLLKQEKCFDVGEALKADYVVVGSALLQGLKWHAFVRVLSVQHKTLVATADVEYSVEEMNLLYGVLASRIGAALANPPKPYASQKDFTWKGEYLLSFGKHRIDIEPPMLIAMNADPPFELSIVAEMATARGGNAVTNFEVFVDDLGLGSVYGALSPPVPIKSREWSIGDCTYIFGLELKEMRVFTERVEGEEAKFVTSARILVTARPRNERD
jgi:TolB-like protein